MRFVLDARTATGHFPGIGRYAFNLARAMVPRLDPAEELIVLRHASPAGPAPWALDTLAEGPAGARVVDVPASPFELRQQWLLPRRLRQLGAALYHSPYYLMPYRPGVPAVVTVHDLIPLLYPQYFTAGQRLIFALTIRAATRTARQIVAVSNATARDLERLLGPLAGRGAARVSVIPEAADPTFGPRPDREIAALRARLGLPERYVLYLGSNKPHKNLVRLVEAWARLPPQPLPLALAGLWDPRFPEARLRAEALGLGDAVRFLGSVPEPDLPALYGGATAFVFPSEYEGFGLPVLEAMACGAPVACARTSSLAEIAGDAALMFDPAGEEAIAQALAQLLSTPDLRAELRDRGRERAAQFSWQRAAQETLALYRQMV